jgi:dTDP-4-dehydrorhamnose 3,5-epimerase
MTLTETAIPGAWIIDPDVHDDERGFFARTFDHRVFARAGLETAWRQCSISYNVRQGTLRGLHYQKPPHQETKLVRCARGAIHDVILDLRPWSPAFRQHVAVCLTAENRRELYIPRGVAHGFQTLEDDSEMFYQITPEYAPHAATGVRFDDPAFRIEWPLPVAVISDRDRGFPAFEYERHLAGLAHTE